MHNIDCLSNDKILFKFDLKMSSFDRTVFPIEEVDIIKQFYITNNSKCIELFPKFKKANANLDQEKEIIERFKIDKMKLKDNDFENFVKPLPISSERTELNKWKEIKEIIKKDLDLLQRLNFMDYSLILCVIDCSNEESKDNKSSFVFYDSDKNDKSNNFYTLIRDKMNHLYSSSKNFIYVLGIIDFFQKYDIKKKSEKLIKKELKFAKESTVNEDLTVKDSKAYAERFFSNLDNLFIH